MQYDFDRVIDRTGTSSMKYDDPDYVPSMAPGIRLDGHTIRLLLADMDFQVAPAITKAMHRVADYPTFGYTTADGDPEYRGSIIRWFKRRYHMDIKREWVVHSNGALDGVGRTVEAFSQPGDGVILCGPVYSNFTGVVKGMGREVVRCHMLQEELGDYRMDWDKFRQVCAQPKNKVFILCSPNNPVGRVWEVEELRQMAAICRENGVVLVSDEIHADFLRQGVEHHPILRAVEDHSNLILVSGVNKSFNLMALHCAYSIIPDDALREKFVTGYDTGMPTPFAVAATIAAYDECEDWLAQLNAYLDKTMAWVVGYIREKLPKVKAYLPQGTYILWLDFGAYGYESGTLQYIVDGMANVAMQGGLSHDPEQGEHYMRMCVTSPRAVMQEAIDRMAAAFEKFEREQADK